MPTINTQELGAKAVACLLAVSSNNELCSAFSDHWARVTSNRSNIMTRLAGELVVDSLNFSMNFANIKQDSRESLTRLFFIEWNDPSPKTVGALQQANKDANDAARYRKYRALAIASLSSYITTDDFDEGIDNAKMPKDVAGNPIFWQSCIKKEPSHK